MSYTEQHAREILAEIHADRRRGLRMPYGFKVERVASEEIPNMFVPDLLSEQRVTIDMKVPVIYSHRPGPWRTQACPPADRENLDWLRGAIVSRSRACGLRGRLVEWTVTPEEDPPPYHPDGTPNGPPAEWSVTAVLELP
jgi:hypothetical protein